MCLIVVKDDANASFSIPDFRASYSRNNDGTGIMYVENGRIVVEKTVGVYKDHLDLYYKNMHRKQFVLHHRMATHGDKTVNNVHPFKVMSIDDGDPYDLYMAHNGGIAMSKLDDDPEKKLSDTHLFVLQYLQPLMKQYPDIIESKPFQIMLHDFIGYNKLAFLRNDGLCLIFNKQAGEFHNGCWLSNKYSINSNQNTNNYGRKHGAWGGYSEEEDTTYLGNYSDWKPAANDDGWKEDWKQANNMKAKAESSMSGLDVNGIVDAINEYAGMTEASLENLFIEEPLLVFDMINLLETKEVSDGLLNENAKTVATQIYELLQGYAKKKAA